mmetsp:Transcript_25493/g.71294  ORF Transcript_25493/g.71294 Transcript_25493/m.71294 type:complete len:131 (-) Transcript_25493:152-544(-)
MTVEAVASRRFYPRTDEQSLAEQLDFLQAAGEAGSLICVRNSADGQKCLYLHKQGPDLMLLDGYCNHSDLNSSGRLLMVRADCGIKMSSSIVGMMRWLLVLGALGIWSGTDLWSIIPTTTISGRPVTHSS